MPARALARAVLRRQRRRRRRRLCAGGADGGHQPALHRRLPRHHVGAQSAVGDDRQPHLLGQRPRLRHAPCRLEARARHERSRAALDRQLAGRRRQRLPAPGRLRHHRRLRGHGNSLSRPRPQGSRAPPRQHHRRLHARQDADPRARAEGRWRHDRAAQGRADAEPRADAGEQPRLHPRRPVRQHRARLQLGAGHQVRAQDCRLRRHRSRLRRRSRRREVLRHQVPQGGPVARMWRSSSPPCAR